MKATYALVVTLSVHAAAAMTLEKPVLESYAGRAAFLAKDKFDGCRGDPECVNQLNMVLKVNDALHNAEELEKKAEKAESDGKALKEAAQEVKAAAKEESAAVAEELEKKAEKAESDGKALKE